MIQPEPKPRRFGTHAAVIQMLALLITGMTLDGGIMLKACTLASLLFWTGSVMLLWWHRGRASLIDLLFFRWGLLAFASIGTLLLRSIVGPLEWLGPMLYLSMATMLVASLMYLVTRVFGLRSPFDDMPPWPEV